MTPDPRLFPNVIKRKAETADDKAGAVCELVTAVTFGLRRDTYTPPILDRHPGRGQTSTGVRNRGPRG